MYLLNIGHFSQRKPDPMISTPRVRGVAWVSLWSCCLWACARDPAGAGGSADPAQHTTGAHDEQVVATVGRTQITVGDVLREYENLEPAVRLRFSSVERKKELLKRLVQRELLAQEAAKRGLATHPAVVRRVRRALAETMAAELRQELVRLEDITEADVRAHFQQHREQWEGPDDQAYARARQPIRTRLFEQRRTAALKEYVARLRNAAKVEVDQQRLARLEQDTDTATPQPPDRTQGTDDGGAAAAAVDAGD